MTGGIDYDYQDTHRDARVPEPGKGRRSGMRKVGGLLTGLFTMCLVLAVAAGGGFIYLNKKFEQAGPLKTEMTVMINRGEGTRLIAEKLYDAGAVSNDGIFLLGLFVNRANGKLQAGEYLIEANASMQDIMRMLVGGKSLQYKVTIPEGLTTLQILRRIEENEILVGEIQDTVPEGALLPDTYNFTRGTTRADVVERMQDAQTKLLDDMWGNRAADLPIASPREALVLASIVEKETGLASERRRVAGVFINRLRKNMRLQSDPTIVYGIVGGEGPLGRPIRKSDIAQRTDYNTYQIDGLPPTPIANPGKAAIEAVLNPAETKDLFFVADGTGGHAFAETLEEHNRNVLRWREIERQRNQPAEAEETEPETPEPAATDLVDTEPAATDVVDTEPAAAEPAATNLVDTDPADTEPATADDPSQTASLEPEPELPEAAEPPAAVEPPAPQPAPDADPPAPDVAEPQAEPAPDPDEQDTAAVDPSVIPDATPKPKPVLPAAEQPETQEISAIAKAIIENAPSPKPKPPVPRQRARTQVNATQNNDQSQVTVEPLPNAPNTTVPADTPAPEPQRQSPPDANDLR